MQSPVAVLSFSDTVFCLAQPIGGLLVGIFLSRQKRNDWLSNFEQVVQQQLNKSDTSSTEQELVSQQNCLRNLGILFGNINIFFYLFLPIYLMLASINVII